MRKQKKSIVIGALFIAITLILFLPEVSLAGSLEPSEPPAPTMRTLDEIYTRPMWDMFDKVFVDWPDNPRFAVCDNGTTDTGDDAVLDKETGLVWERDPSAKWPGQRFDLSWALLLCNEGFAVDRTGWRLPSFVELWSLLDWTQYPALPIGHPFINVQWGCVGTDCAFYWTSTPTINCIVASRGVDTISFGGARGCAPADWEHYVWCVRGGRSDDADLLLWIK